MIREKNITKLKKIAIDEVHASSFTINIGTKNGNKIYCVTPINYPCVIDIDIPINNSYYINSISVGKIALEGTGYITSTTWEVYTYKTPTGSGTLLRSATKGWAINMQMKMNIKDFLSIQIM